MCQRKYQQGVASLAAMTVLMGLIIALGILVTTISLNENNASANSSDSEKALLYAASGARDAIMRIIRNKNYSGEYELAFVADGCSTSYPGCSLVMVASSSPKIITSQGVFGTIKRRVSVSLNLDTNGLISGYSWQEQ